MGQPKYISIVVSYKENIEKNPSLKSIFLKLNFVASAIFLF